MPPIVYKNFTIRTFNVRGLATPPPIIGSECWSILWWCISKKWRIKRWTALEIVNIMEMVLSIIKWKKLDEQHIQHWHQKHINKSPSVPVKTLKSLERCAALAYESKKDREIWKGPRRHIYKDAEDEKITHWWAGGGETAAMMIEIGVWDQKFTVCLWRVKVNFFFFHLIIICVCIHQRSIL